MNVRCFMCSTWCLILGVFGVFCPTVIEEANWLTLPDDIAEILGDGFDAVICLGNSFSHMPDTTGDRLDQR